MALRRILITVSLLVLTASVANAYTIVMRDGRRVEIPNEFTVTNSTLTYEVAHEIQITIQLAGVDIAATERANGQPKGSFLLRSGAPKVVSTAPQLGMSGKRSITNKDLEGHRRTRVESELDYEKRRKELGLPSLEERRKESAEIQGRTREQLLSMRAQERDEEEYWRNRASPLRAEMAAIRAQIDYVRRRLDETPLTYSFGAFTTGIPFGTVGTSFINFPFQSGITPNVFAPSLVNQGFRARFGVNFGNRRSHFPINPGRFHNPGRFQRGHFGRGGFPLFGGGSLLALPFQSYDSSYERTELSSQLNELEMHHAGLKARWRDLEDEARRAGAYPGWLR